MGLLQKIIDLVKEELQGETKKPAKSQGKQKASASKPKGDSFEQLCAKAKAGDLAAQYNLYDQYADKADKSEALEALFTEMMNNGNAEGEGLLGCLLSTRQGNEKEANDLIKGAIAKGALFPLVFSGIFYACPRGTRRDWDPDVKDRRVLVTPVEPLSAVFYLRKAADKLEQCSDEVRLAYHVVYGHLAYAYMYTTDENNIRKYAMLGAEMNDPISCFVMGRLYDRGGISGIQQNIDYAFRYYNKAEKNAQTMPDTTRAFLYREMGALYNEKGQRKGSVEAFKTSAKYYLKAAELGASYAMIALANYYESGNTLPQDLDKALSLRNKAIAAGYDYNRRKTAPFSL